MNAVSTGGNVIGSINARMGTAVLVHLVEVPDKDLTSPTLPPARAILSPSLVAFVTQLFPSAPVIKSEIAPVGMIKKNACAELEARKIDTRIILSNNFIFASSYVVVFKALFQLAAAGWAVN